MESNIPLIVGGAIGYAVLATIAWIHSLSTVSKFNLAAEEQANLLKSETEAKERAQANLERIERRFANVLDLDVEAAKIDGEIERARAQFELLRSRQNSELAALRTSYKESKAVYDRLRSELAIFDERFAFAEMGVYEPHFDFTDSEDYKKAIERGRAQQKLMISGKTAVVCTTIWQVGGSEAKGRVMTNRNINLTLRAFNNECDAAIANVRWNNANAMERRIIRAREQIDKLNASNATLIQDGYLKHKLEELYLTHEYREKLKAEREQRAEAARLAREEQKLLREVEEAQREEERYQRLLDDAKAEAASVAGPKLEAFKAQIEMLERDLANAHTKAERAQAMAERTRSGYVYIISNIGSFGEDVVKIGLTRRLDPMDRVRELGDASVPFVFDTHAIIYSDDAPALEKALHCEFETTRINTQNYRKEFFRASIDAVEDAVRKLAPGAPFFKDIEAQEFHETVAKRQTALMQSSESESLFPVAV